MQTLIIISLISLFAAILIIIRGRKAAKKPQTANELLKELDWKINCAILNEHSYKAIKSLIADYRKREDMKADMMVLECLEKEFQHRFVEFGGKVVYPDLEKFAELEKTI